MKRFEVKIRTRIKGAIQIRSAEAIANNGIEAMCNVVRALGVDGPMTSSVRPIPPTLPTKGH